MSLVSRINPNQTTSGKSSITVPEPPIFEHTNATGISLWNKLGSLGSLFGGIAKLGGAGATVYESYNAKMISGEVIKMQKEIAEKELALQQAKLDTENARLAIDKDIANRQL
jgi:hypothetical protein